MTDDLPLLRSIHDVSDEKAKDLLIDRLEPEDHTVLFGDGGTGKGVIAAWWVARLTRELGLRVGIIDYEGHARYEWKPRLRTFGANLDLVSIAQPEVAIWDTTEKLREEALALAIDYVVVDSVTYACMGSEVEKSATAARYSAAIRLLGLPALSLAHTTKANADPDHPFGSVFWSNGARLTIGVSKRDDDRLLQAKKVNARAPFPAQLIDWHWTNEMGPSEVPSTLDERPAADSKPGSRARVAMVGKGWMTAKEAAILVNADGGPNLDEQTVRKAMDADSEMQKDGTGRGVAHRYKFGPEWTHSSHTNLPSSE